MPKFFIAHEDVQGKYIVIHKDVHHILNVLRKSVGDKLTLCDGRGVDYECEIIRVSDNEDEIVVKIDDVNRSASEPEVTITLYQSLPKGDKMELILQKGVEIGTSRFVPFYSGRSLIHLESKKAIAKTERWNKIAEAAAKQSGRGHIPKVEAVHTFKEVLQEMKEYDVSILFYENESRTSLKKMLQALPEMPKTVSILIGPEGGFSEEEVSELQQAGAVVCGLGPRILRTETAGFVGATLVLYEYGQMQ